MPGSFSDAYIEQAGGGSSTPASQLLNGTLAGMVNGFYLPLTYTTVNYNNTGPAFTIAPLGATFDYYILNQKYTTTALTYTFGVGLHPAVSEGYWVFYLADTGILNAALITDIEQLDTIYTLNAVCGAGYWDSTDATWMTQQEERHQTSMPAEVHHVLHDSLGARWTSGLGLTNITLAGGNPTGDVDSEFTFTSGAIHDEDIDFIITGPGFPASIPVWYRTGTNNWRIQAASTLPVIYDSVTTHRLLYNLNTAGTWSLADPGQGNFILIHVFATTDLTNPVVSILGQTSYTTTADLRAGAATELEAMYLATLPVPELVPLATLAYQTSTAYTNATKHCKIVAVDAAGDSFIEWRVIGKFGGIL